MRCHESLLRRTLIALHSEGGFSARYGDALSSVLSVENRDGSPASVAGDFTLGAVEAALTLDGPLPTSTDGASNWMPNFGFSVEW